ncbi:MAG: carboxypeptidase regulatory-like domain-containing protein, partial [Pedobacter sp.]
MIMKKFSILGFILFCQVYAFAQQSQLNGRVLTSNGTAVFGATINISPAAKTFTSNTNGVFTYEGRIGETITINISKEGFLKETRTLTLKNTQQTLSIKLAASSYLL